MHPQRRDHYLITAPAQLSLRCPRTLLVAVPTILVHQLDPRKAYRGQQSQPGIRSTYLGTDVPFLEIEAYPGFAFLLPEIDINFIC
jgi:hypothetical protein